VPKYKIVVRENASKDNVYTEDYEGEKYEVERRAGHIWNSPYASMPDRYRLYVFEKGQKRQFMTIG
jgi:hypothetical protein